MSSNANKRFERATARDVGQHLHTNFLNEKRKYRFKLELFLKKIFPEKFYRPFSKDLKRFIEDIQDVILNGGQEAIAMPRGEGKTTTIQCAIIWAIGYGHRKYIVIIGPDQGAAEKILDGIKITIDSMENLNRIFPEIVHYVTKLQGLAQRAAGQLCNGHPTGIVWKREIIILPSVPMKPEFLELSAGAVIESRGLTGRLRGLQITCGDGSVVRPDFVFLDDPQTRESALSATQCNEREDLIKADVMGLAGVGVELSALMACTVIGQGDLAERILNQWRSVRAKAVYVFPDAHKTLWAQYVQMRQEARKEGTEQKLCNDFYRKHRKEMDKGSRVGNKHRKNKGELSALQNAYNYLSDNGEMSFYSELQNEPQAMCSKFYVISRDIILSRTNGFERNIIPPDCHYVNVGIDVNYYALNWAVSAIQNDMTGFGIDYGRYPKGRALWDDASDKQAELAIYDGIIELCNLLIERQPGIKLIGIDGNYATDTIYRVAQYLDRIMKCRVMVFRGVGSDKYNLPNNPKTVITKGYECNMSRGGRGEQVIFNSHYWHTYLQKAFLLSPGFRGAFSFWGDRNEDHRTIADNIIADKLIEIEYKQGKEILSWTKKPGDRNDLADALKISLVGASIFGAEMSGQAEPVAAPVGKDENKDTEIRFIQI